MDPADAEVLDASSHASAPVPEKDPTSSARLDLWLTVALWVVGVSFVALGAFFAYSVYAQQQADRLANPAYIAVDSLVKQIAAKPKDPTLHVRLAEALATTGQLEKAKQELYTAINLNGQYAGAYQDLASIELSQSDYKDSAAHWQKVLDLTASSEMQDVNARREVAYFNLGQIALVQKDYISAVGDFKAALQIRKDASDTYLLLAKAYEGLDQNDQALEQVNAALAFDPKLAEAHYVRGKIYRAQSDMVDAAWDFRAALDGAPGNPEALAAIDSLGTFESWFGKAQTAWGSHETSAALDAVHIARSIDPGSYEAAMLDGRYSLSSGETTSAVSAFGAALKAKPNDPAATAALKGAKATGKE